MATVFRVEITNLTNDAMTDESGDWRESVAELLHHVATQLTEYGPTTGALRDANGNVVGRYEEE